jgi:Leucine-rich repeat (LRR) protein
MKAFHDFGVTMRRLLVLCLLCLMTVAPLSAQDDDPYTIALQRIEEARESGAIVLLDLSVLNLTTVPHEIGQLSNLQRLDLGSNQLTMLPPEIGQLSNLQQLSLSSNQLASLPPEIGQLSNLQSLWLDANQLASLPPEIGQLSNLQILSLGENRLTSLPPEIGQLSNLLWLYLDYNELTTLPLEIGLLNNLCFLSLVDNNLKSLPMTLGNLSLLTSGGNCFNSFSDLRLDGNPLISPPEVVEQGTAAVLEYLRNQAWYHTQRLMIGAATGIGTFALFILGIRWKQHGGRKPKQKRGV